MSSTSPTTSVLPVEWTLADVVLRLGEIPLHRVRAVPPPGTATLADAAAAKPRYGRVCELIDGVLVEKTVGYYESLVAMRLGAVLVEFVRQHDLGIVLGEAGTLEILPGQVRAPDVCYVSWERLPGRKLPPEPIPAIVPDLAMEILSGGNTPAELQRKLDEYFRAGVRQVWYIDPAHRTAEVYAERERRTLVDAGGFLDAADVLPGFRVALAELFPA